MKQEILNIITGEAPLSKIADLGIEIKQEPDKMLLLSKLTNSLVYPTVSDLVKGFTVYKNQPAKLKLWAFFCLAESGAIDFSEIENHPFGERIIEELWEASETGLVSEDFLNQARLFEEIV